MTGTKGRILLSCSEALRAAGKTATLAPDSTLRETLERNGSLPPATRQALARLTRLAEIALYSNSEPDENMAAEAERLSADIKRGISGASSG